MQWYFQLGNWEESINSIKLYLCDTAVLIKLCCLFFFCWLVGWFGFFLVSSSKMNCMVKTKVGDNQVKEYIQVTATSNAWQQLSATSDVLLAGRLAKYSTWHVIKRWFMLTNNFRLPETHLLPCFVWMQSGLEKKKSLSQYCWNPDFTTYVPYIGVQWPAIAQNKACFIIS